MLKMRFLTILLLVLGLLLAGFDTKPTNQTSVKSVTKPTNQTSVELVTKPTNQTAVESETTPAYRPIGDYDYDLTMTKENIARMCEMLEGGAPHLDEELTVYLCGVGDTDCVVTSILDCPQPPQAVTLFPPRMAGPA
uniref:Secreted protein n=2 Tax=Caenorhabditis tropicalis TaxID=1561998 RepID=A0A1I7TW61_9PELO